MPPADFAAKNERRRAQRARLGGAQYRKMRLARRRLARNGAFGKFDKDTVEWQMCAYGRASTVGDDE